jgi:hypothetical protein
MSKTPGEWKPADATRRINDCARHADFRIALTMHAKEQMLARDLFVGDLLHLLKKGFVYDKAEPATREGFFKYAVEGTTPNSEGRTVKAIVIPGTGHEAKIVTVMWRDE